MQPPFWGEQKECWTHSELCAEICFQSPAFVSRFFPHAFSRVTCVEYGENHSVSFTPRYVHGSIPRFLRPVLSAQIVSTFLNQTLTKRIHSELCAEICVQSPTLVFRFFPHAFNKVACAEYGGNHNVSFTPRYVHGSVPRLLRFVLSAQILSAFLDSDSDQEDPQ